MMLRDNGVGARDTQENSGGESSDKRVRDEEGNVDQKLKDGIVYARNKVDEIEEECFIGSRLDPEISLSHGGRLEIWSTSVKQFLRRIEPLLRSDEIPKSDYYYQEVEIADTVLYPPDGETVVDLAGRNDETVINIPWSRYYEDERDRRTIVSSSSLLGQGFEPPEPEPVEIRGLKEVIEREGVAASWVVKLNPQAIGPQVNMAYPSISKPLQKDWLVKAVRKADEFLQQAGIGLDIGHEQTDDPDDTPF